MVVKKPKGISSDLISVTGQWAVVVRPIMNGTRVLKVYLVQTKKFAIWLYISATHWHQSGCWNAKGS
jgi:hypothetical protein